MTALKTYIVSAILAIVFNAQDTLWATPNHPFWHKGHYVEASALHTGDTIEALEGGYDRIQQIIPFSGERRVYNFTVAENSNYYVGSRGVLVHNDCFLKRLTDSPELIARIDALPDALKGQFIQDFYEAGEDVIKVLKEKPGCVKAREVAAKHNDEIRKSTDFLTSLSNKINEFPHLPEDLTDDVVFDAVKKFHDNLPQSHEIIDDLAGDLVDVIANKTKNSKSPEFWKWIQRGRKFEKEYLLPRLKNRASDEYIQLREKVQNTCDVNLDQYDMYSQVQFKYNDVGDYFVADQLYVKWGKDEFGVDKIQDIVVVEDKLSSGTRLTTNQNAGKRATSLTVRSVELFPQSSVSGNALTNQLPSINTNDKWLKIFDSENGDRISDIVRL